MKKNLFLLVATFSVLLTSCVKNEMIADYGDQESLLVKASISSNDQEGVKTRSAVATFSTSVIGLFVDDVAGDYAPTKNSIATVSSGANTATTSPLIYINAAATVYAYYPAVADELSNPTSASTKAITVVSSDNFSAAAQTDYMWATPVAVQKSARTAALTFNHALSKVVFSIALGSGYAGAGSLTSVSLTAANAAYKFKTGTGTMAISDGAIAALTNTNTLTYTGTQALSTTASTVSALVAPTTLALDALATSEVTLSMTIDGQTYTKLLPVNLVFAWAPAYSYTYNITVNSGTLIVGAVSITDWTAGTSTDVSVE